MLAPFTAGWQSTDLHPLVIEKSEVITSVTYVFPFVLVFTDDHTYLESI